MSTAENPGDPRRLRIVKSICRYLEEIEYEPGKTLAGRVFRGREWFGPNDPCPMVSVLEPPLAVEQRINRGPDNTVNAGGWDILIQGWVNDDKDNPCDPAYFMAAWITQKIAQAQTGVVPGIRKGQPGYGRNLLIPGNSVMKITVGQPVVRPPERDQGAGKACCYVVLTLDLADDYGNPFESDG